MTLIGTTDTDITVDTSADSATVTISDNDAGIVSLIANDPMAAEPANDGQFTVTLSNASDTDTVISYTVTGDAPSADDFTPLTGSVTILAHQQAPPSICWLPMTRLWKTASQSR